jgi:hypothetical protein
MSNRSFVSRVTLGLTHPELAFKYIQKKIDDEFYSFLWFVLSPLLRSLSKKKGVSQVLRRERIKHIYFLEPGPHNLLKIEKTPAFLSGASLYTPNLSHLAMSWLGQEFSDEVIPISFDSAKLLRQREGGLALATFASPTLSGPRKLVYFFHIFKLAHSLKNKGVPVIVFLPDTFYPDAAIVSSSLAAITGGITVFLQSTSSEAEKYGYPNVVDSLFWTWPKERLDQVQTFVPWNERANRAVLPANNTGGKVRELAVLKFTTDLVAGARFSTTSTGGELRSDEYLTLLTNSKICMTTNLTQPSFYRGLKRHRDLVSPTTTTGRVWEAFLTGTVLVANETKVLIKLGFVAGIHYISLEQLDDLNKTVNDWLDKDLEAIARMGQKQFRKLVGGPTALYT